MDAHSNNKLVKGQEMAGQVDISPYISDHDSIHDYNDGDESDTSDDESQPGQDRETDGEENSTLDEDEYATFKNKIKIKRGRSIGLSFKPNGYLIPNRQLAYLLRARKLVLYGPFNENELNAPLGESNFCPSLQDVLWRLSGLKFRANGRAMFTLKEPYLTKVLSSASTSRHGGRDGNDTSTLFKYLHHLGVSFDANGTITNNHRLKTSLDAGKIALDKSTHGYTLPKFSKPKKRLRFESGFANASTFFFVSRPTSEILLGFDQQQKSSRRNLKKGLSKQNETGESEGDGIISGVGFIPVNNNDLEILGSTRFIISLGDLIFAMADEKKLLLPRSSHNCTTGISINGLLSTLQKNDSRKFSYCNDINSTISSKTEDSKFVTGIWNYCETDSESDPDILSTVPFEEAGNLFQKFKTTISQACPEYQKGARPKFRPKRNPFASQPTISLPPWSSIKFTYTPVGHISAKFRRIENVLVKVNKRVIMIIDIFNESFNILGGSKKMYLPLVFRCWLRARVVA